MFLPFSIWIFQFEKMNSKVVKTVGNSIMLFCVYDLYYQKYLGASKWGLFLQTLWLFNFLHIDIVGAFGNILFLQRFCWDRVFTSVLPNRVSISSTLLALPRYTISLGSPACFYEIFIENHCYKVYASHSMTKKLCLGRRKTERGWSRSVSCQNTRRGFGRKSVKVFRNWKQTFSLS